MITNENNNHNFFDSAEKRLWQAVILQALMDLEIIPSTPEEEFIKSSSMNWLLYDKSDFYSICHFANISAKLVRNIARTIISNQKSGSFYKSIFDIQSLENAPKRWSKRSYSKENYKNYHKNKEKKKVKMEVMNKMNIAESLKVS